MDFDLVVIVRDSDAEECPVRPGRAVRRVHHGFIDPAKAEGTPEERKQVSRQVCNELLEVIPTFLEDAL